MGMPRPELCLCREPKEGSEMSSAVRYYSRSGHTKAAAEAIAEGAGTTAVSVDDAGAALTEKVDVLFVGGALYAYGLDKHLKEYLSGIDPVMVGRAAVFSTAWLSKHALDLIGNALREKGIEVADETLFIRSRPTEEDLKRAEEFGRKISQ